MCCYIPFVVWVWTDGMSNCHCLCSISLYLKNDNSILRDLSTHSAPAGKVSRSLMQICRDIKLMIVNIKCFFHIYYIHTYKSTYYICFLRSFNSFVGTELLFPFRMLPYGTQVELPRHPWLYVTRGYSNMLLLHQNWPMYTLQYLFTLTTIDCEQGYVHYINCIIITVFTYRHTNAMVKPGYSPYIITQLHFNDSPCTLQLGHV